MSFRRLTFPFSTWCVHLPRGSARVLPRSFCARIVRVVRTCTYGSRNVGGERGGGMRSAATVSNAPPAGGTLSSPCPSSNPSVSADWALFWSAFCPHMGRPLPSHGKVACGSTDEGRAVPLSTPTLAQPSRAVPVARPCFHSDEDEPASIGVSAGKEEAGPGALMLSLRAGRWSMEGANETSLFDTVDALGEADAAAFFATVSPTLRVHSSFTRQTSPFRLPFPISFSTMLLPFCLRIHSRLNCASAHRRRTWTRLCASKAPSPRM
ncbi:hypothetical protein C8R47DRAFT_1220078 [Mycena vitilis]|nr:hypothetical protein C8R47DRAFT_1220078 [Mycena vitilis]